MKMNKSLLNNAKNGYGRLNKGKETIRYCTLISLIRERYEEI